MLHDPAVSFIVKKLAQEVSSLYCVVLPWRRQDGEDNARKARAVKGVKARSVSLHSGAAARFAAANEPSVPKLASQSFTLFLDCQLQIFCWMRSFSVRHLLGDRLLELLRCFHKFHKKEFPEWINTQIQFRFLLAQSRFELNRRQYFPVHFCKKDSGSLLVRTPPP